MGEGDLGVWVEGVLSSSRIRGVSEGSCDIDPAAVSKRFKVLRSGVLDDLPWVQTEEGRGRDDTSFQARNHVNDMTVRLPRVEAHSTPDHLDEEIPGFGGAREDDAVDVGNVGALGEDAAVDEHRELPPLEGVECFTTLNGRRVARDEPRVDTVMAELLRKARYVGEVHAEDEGGFPLLLRTTGVSQPAPYGDLVDVVRVHGAGKFAGSEIAVGTASHGGDVCRGLHRREEDVAQPLLGNHVDVIPVIDDLVDSST